MIKKRGPGRPASQPDPETRIKNSNNSNQNNYLSFAKNVVSGDNGNGDGVGDGRGKKRKQINNFCRCPTCQIVDRSSEETKSME